MGREPSFRGRAARAGRCDGSEGRTTSATALLVRRLNAGIVLKRERVLRTCWMPSAQTRPAGSVVRIARRGWERRRLGVRGVAAALSRGTAWPLRSTTDASPACTVDPRDVEVCGGLRSSDRGVSGESVRHELARALEGASRRAGSDPEQQRRDGAVDRHVEQREGDRARDARTRRSGCLSMRMSRRRSRPKTVISQATREHDRQREQERPGALRAARHSSGR